MAADDATPWGRVDETGTVFVRTAEGEREVGQFPDGDPAEALAYFERKFTELAGQVALLEQRVKRGAPAADVAKAAAALTETISGAAAVGELAALQTRVTAIASDVEKLAEKQSEEAKAAVEAGIVFRTGIVEAAEALAAQDLGSVQWKKVSAELDELFAGWQKHQQEGPRLPKSESNELWKRFRAAKSTIETARRAFFASQDALHKEATGRKHELIRRAEALAPKGADGVTAYRELLEEWKRAGRASRKTDDALWAKFKAAGDVLYGAKAEVDAKLDEEYAGNLTAKLALLEEAEPLLAETDRERARTLLRSIQERWDAIGRVPRDQVRVVEDRIRKVESAVKKLEDEHWKRNDPDKKARSEGLASQLEEAIAKLESELTEAKADGDAKRIAEAEEALAARKAWLGAIG